MPLLELSDRQVVELVKQLPPDMQREALSALAEGGRPREAQVAEVAKEFRRLADEWKDATRFQSSIHEMVSHPAYLRIIGMGKEALPLLIAALRREPDHWFVALQAITGQNPIPPSAHGNVDKMTEAWLQWAEQHGL